ncbi:MAG: hypothetical protein MIO93_12985 [ANME-2 cluster archaeon]|nr:hypothetical protein [ANME-2 cluster archaeon]
MENQRDTTHDAAVGLGLVGAGLGFLAFGPAGMIIGGALGALAGSNNEENDDDW